MWQATAGDPSKEVSAKKSLINESEPVNFAAIVKGGPVDR